MSDQDKLSTVYRDPNPATARFPFSPLVPAPSNSPFEMLTVYRYQDNGAGFSVAITNRSKITAFTLNLKHSNDAGQNDAYANLTFRIGSTTATSVTIQPGGYAEIVIDASASIKPYLAIFSDTANAFGNADFIYNNGTFDRVTAKPIIVTALDPQYASFDSGVVVIPGTSTLTQVILIKADGKPVRLDGTVGANDITGMSIYDTAVIGGTQRLLAQDADLNTATDPGVAQSRPDDAYETLANDTFSLLLNSGGMEYAIWVKAGSATTLRIIGSVLAKAPGL